MSLFLKVMRNIEFLWVCGMCVHACACVFMGIVSGCLMNEHGEKKREERLPTTVVFSSMLNLKKKIHLNFCIKLLCGTCRKTFLMVSLKLLNIIYQQFYSSKHMLKGLPNLSSLVWIVIQLMPIWKLCWICSSSLYKAW